MTNKKTKISAVVIAKNEEKKIEDCLKSIKWCDEIILVDSGSTDNTIRVAKNLGVNVITTKNGGFSDWRNIGLNEVKYDWILYVDADERINEKLKDEIISVVNFAGKYSWYAIPRKNNILGKDMMHGGWYPDYVKRLFKKDSLKKWVNELHEEPIVDGEMGYLKNDLIHVKHASLSEMVAKTNKWSEIEAKLMFEANHPKMSWWRFVRIMLTELIDRLIIKRGFLDGGEGVIYAFYQMWSRFISYAKLWEMQLKTNNL